MAEILTLAGTAVRRGPATRPASRSDGCPIGEAAKDIIPLNDRLAHVEMTVSALLTALGGQTDELIDRVEEIVERVITRQPEIDISNVVAMMERPLWIGECGNE